MNGTPISRIDDVIRSGFATNLRFSHRQDDQELETGEKSVQVLYSSFELSDTAGDRTSMKLRLWLDANEMWIVDLTVAKPFRLQNVGRELVQVAEAIASNTKLDVVILFPLRPSEAFWARLGYFPHKHTAKVLSKGCESCTSIPSAENLSSLDRSFRTKPTQKNSM